MLRSDFVFSGAVQVPSLAVKRTLCADSRVRVFEERPVGLPKTDFPRELLKMFKMGNSSPPGDFSLERTPLR